jgi:hypothetical protein
MLARGFIQIFITVNDDGEFMDADVMDTNLDSDEIDAAAKVILHDKKHRLREIVVDALWEEVETPWTTKDGDDLIDPPPWVDLPDSDDPPF